MVTRWRGDVHVALQYSYDQGNKSPGKWWGLPSLLPLGIIHLLGQHGLDTCPAPGADQVCRKQERAVSWERQTGDARRQGRRGSGVPCSRQPFWGHRRGETWFFLRVGGSGQGTFPKDGTVELIL